MAAQQASVSEGERVSSLPDGIDEEMAAVLKAIGESNYKDVVSMQKAIYQASTMEGRNASGDLSSLQLQQQQEPSSLLQMGTPTASPAGPLPTQPASLKPTPNVVRPKQLQGIEMPANTWLSLGCYEELLNSSFDYWTITKQLKDNGLERVKILKIHNRNMETQFEQEKQLLLKNKPKDYDLNIEELYHGTTAPLDVVCYEGLDNRLMHQGHFGKGIYFSDNPDMCRAYCEDPANPKEENFLVRCQVILGEPKIYAPDNYDIDLKREPYKFDASGKQIGRFDSVQGRVGNYSQYVVYDKRRVFVQYIVYYKAIGNRPVPLIPEVVAPSKRPKRTKETPTSDKASTTAAATARRPRTPPPSDSMTQGRPDSETSDGEGSVTSFGDVDFANSATGRRASVTSLSDADFTYSSGATLTERRLSFSSDDVGSSGGAVGGSTLSAGVAQATLPLTDTPVPKVSCVRNRTVNLKNATSVDVGSAISSSLQPSAATADTQALIDSKPAAAPVNLENFRAVQQAAIRQMMELKGKIPESEFDQLLLSYEQTYGSMFHDSSLTLTPVIDDPSGATVKPRVQPPAVSSPAATARYTSAYGAAAAATFVDADEDDDDPNAQIQQVLDQAIREFQEIAIGVDAATARQCIIDNDMDVTRAVNAFYGN